MDEHLSLKEQGRRKEIFEQAQNIVLQALPVEVAEGAYTGLLRFLSANRILPTTPIDGILSGTTTGRP